MSASQSDTAYDYIRSRILSAEFIPGKSLSALGLSKEIGLSRNPVMVALRRLETDGLVTITPNLGATVRTINSPQDYKELLSLREVLETFAAELAAERRTEEDLTLLDAELQELAALTKGPKPGMSEAERQGNLSAVDARFHLRMVQAARHSLLLKEITRLQVIYRVVAQSNGSAECAPALLAKLRAEALKQHRQIFEAIRDRNPARARAALKKHLQSISKNQVTVLAALEDARLLEAVIVKKR